MTKLQVGGRGKEAGPEGSKPTLSAAIAANINPEAILGVLRHISYHVRHF